jgi:hypothetical protein
LHFPNPITVCPYKTDTFLFPKRKTVQALACAAAYKDEWPCLILVPTSLRGAWEQALVKWLGDSLLAPCKGMVRNANNANNSFIAAVGTGAEQKKLDAPNVKFAIVPYSLVTKVRVAFPKSRLPVCPYNADNFFYLKMSDLLLHKQYKVVICDESHFLKDSKAQRTKAVIPLLKNATRALCLTGTPALSRPVEIFSQAEGTAGGRFPNPTTVCQYKTDTFFFVSQPFGPWCSRSSTSSHSGTAPGRGSGGTGHQTLGSCTRCCHGW